MDYLITLLLAVMAQVVGHYVCKWLERHKHDNQPNEKSRSCRSGIFFCVSSMEHLITLLVITIIKHIQAFCQIFKFRIFSKDDNCDNNEFFSSFRRLSVSGSVISQASRADSSTSSLYLFSYPYQLPFLILQRKRIFHFILSLTFPAIYPTRFSFFPVRDYFPTR